MVTIIIRGCGRRRGRSAHISSSSNSVTALSCGTAVSSTIAPRICFFAEIGLNKGGNPVVFSRLLANESTVGVDIGTSSIKIVHAEMTKQGLSVPHAIICPTPRDTVKEGVIVNVPEVAAALQFAMRSAGLRASNGVAAIAGPGVLVRHVQLPEMPATVLRKSIHFEAAKFISASIEDSVIEFEILGGGDEPGQMKVMLVAAPKQMVESRTAVLEQAGLEPLAIDVEAFASFRALVECNPNQALANSSVALLDIGASHTEINLVSKGNLVLTRTVPIAGASLTTAIKNAENCSDEEAEQRKYDLDLHELIASPPGSHTDQALKVVQSLIDEILREIRRSINYLQSQMPEGAAETTVEKIILSGGSSRLKGLADYTNSRLGMDVRIGNPALYDAITSLSETGLTEDEIPLLTVAFGLAIKELPGVAQVFQAA